MSTRFPDKGLPQGSEPLSSGTEAHLVVGGLLFRDARTEVDLHERDAPSHAELRDLREGVAHQQLLGGGGGLQTSVTSIEGPVHQQLHGGHTTR